MAAGDARAALLWLERAARIAPRDQTARLALALMRLAQGLPGQSDILADIAARFDLRLAWIGLASARRAEGDAEGAASALAAAFSRHAGPIDAHLAIGADAIAAESGRPGWCALEQGLRLRIKTADNAARVRVLCDGVPLTLRFRAGRAQLRPQFGRTLAVSTDAGVPLLGSPIDLSAPQRLEGMVTAEGGDLVGWAWHPADPEATPRVFLRDRHHRLIAHTQARDLSVSIPDVAPLARPRGFRFPASCFAAAAPPVSVTDAEGRALLGSPLDPGAEWASAAAAARLLAGIRPGKSHGRASRAAQPAIHADLRGPAAERGRARKRRVSVIVPVYRGLSETRASLEAVWPSLPPWARLILVEDASPDPDLIAFVRAFAKGHRMRLLRLSRNHGFPGAANAGILAAGRDDVVLLNSDTLVAGDWLTRLRDAAYAEPAIATATPFSNDATVMSYPKRAGGNPMPDLAATRRLDEHAARANKGVVVEIPVGVGFCLYIRRVALDEVGLLRADVFAQGYGEENDFCLRARALGWRHVAATGVFVAHHGGVSFGTGQAALRARNAALLARLHPGYDALITAHLAADPLAPARRRLDRARFVASRRRGAPSVLLVTHDRGGGVETRLAARIAAREAVGWRVLVLRGSPRDAGGAPRSHLSRGDAAETYPNLGFDLPGESRALLSLLRAERVALIEIHHLLGHDHDAVMAICRALACPYEVHVHDYAWLCPRIKLLGAEGHYCGEPPVAACGFCVADAGREIEEEIDAASLRARSGCVLADAARVIAPTRDVAARLVRHFPVLNPVVTPWETLPDNPARAPARSADGVLRVIIAGAIGAEKGYRILLACARDAALRELPLYFIVVGVSIDDDRLLATGKAFITGDYQPEEAVALIAAQAGGIGFLPSVVPETWGYTLSELWRAGLFVAAFNLGAQAERIRASGRGFLLPPDLPPSAVNDALLAIADQQSRGQFTE